MNFSANLAAMISVAWERLQFSRPPSETHYGHRVAAGALPPPALSAAPHLDQADKDRPAGKSCHVALLTRTPTGRGDPVGDLSLNDGGNAAARRGLERLDT
jgi:hypothetical protein